MILLFRGIPPRSAPGLSEITVGGGIVADWIVNPPGTFSTSELVVVVTSTGPEWRPGRW